LGKKVSATITRENAVYFRNRSCHAVTGSLTVIWIMLPARWPDPRLGTATGGVVFHQ